MRRSRPCLMAGSFLCPPHGGPSRTGAHRMTAPEENEPAEGNEAEDRTDWKSEARKWETRAKENAAEMGKKAVDTARDLADKAGKKIEEMKK